MKFILLLSCFVCSLSHAQGNTALKIADTSKTLDTLEYLKSNFEIKKRQYIGKPFSCLLSKMLKIQPKTVWNTPAMNDSTTVEKSLFRFYDINYPILNETKMLITWQTGFSYKALIAKIYYLGQEYI